MGEANASLRLDKWLWYARFAKTRSLAARLCLTGDVALGGVTVEKAHQMIRVGDVVTIRLGRSLRRVEIQALGERRGPAPEARLLYRETQPPMPIQEREEWVPLLDPD